MGVDKSQVVVGTATMLEHVIAALTQVSDEVVISGRSVPGHHSLPDPGIPHRGPRAGLASAVSSYPGSVLVVVAVDQPWVRAETLRHLIALTDQLPVLPVSDGIRQTTCAVYPADALDGIDDELVGGGSMQSLVDRISFQPVIEDEWLAWNEDGRSWFSVDSATDIDTGLDRFGPP